VKGSAPTLSSTAHGPRRITFEVLGAFAFATAIAAALYRVPALGGYFHAIVAGLFLYLPAWLLRRRDLADYGFTAQPLGGNLLLVGAAVVTIFPLFAVGFAAWAAIACRVPGLAWLAPGPCGAGLSALLHRFVPRLPSGIARMAAAEVLVVALPEELFFRGYVQGRLAEAWPARRRLLGAPVGGALVAASALFALCHLAVQGNPATLAVFFPGLVFGWLRARSGSILPGTLFHALCNLYIETLHRSFFG
jgi:membrane protease YdiL (CAAX protease family)